MYTAKQLGQALRTMVYEQLEGFSESAHEYAIGRLEEFGIGKDQANQAIEQEDPMIHNTYWTLRNEFEKQVLVNAMVDEG